MIQSEFKPCPICRGTGQAHNDDEEYSDECERCEGSGYIEIIKHKQEKPKKE